MELRESTHSRMPPAAAAAVPPMSPPNSINPLLFSHRTGSFSQAVTPSLLAEGDSVLPRPLLLSNVALSALSTPLPTEAQCRQSLMFIETLTSLGYKVTKNDQVVDSLEIAPFFPVFNNGTRLDQVQLSPRSLETLQQITQGRASTTFREYFSACLNKNRPVETFDIPVLYESYLDEVMYRSFSEQEVLEAFLKLVHYGVVEEKWEQYFAECFVDNMFHMPDSNKIIFTLSEAKAQIVTQIDSLKGMKFKIFDYAISGNMVYMLANNTMYPEGSDPISFVNITVFWYVGEGKFIGSQDYMDNAEVQKRVISHLGRDTLHSGSALKKFLSVFCLK